MANSGGRKTADDTGGSHAPQGPDQGAEMGRTPGQPVTDNKDARGLTTDRDRRPGQPAGDNPAGGGWRSADSEPKGD